MTDLVNISISNAAATALLGYLVVFCGLVLLMIVIMILGKVMTSRAGKAAAAEPASETADTPAVPAVPAVKAPGTAGELKLYDTDPRDAAMIMAIVADELGKPLNELRFLSIREIKEEDNK